MAQALEKILGKSVVVDNRSGAGGMLGNAFAARAEPDGHTLLMALSSMTFLPEAERLYDRKPSYELDQFIPIARVLADPGVLCVRADAPWKTVADLVADAKKRPGQISFSSSGNYGAAHVPFEMFQQAAGIKLLHVPYRGGGPALTAFLGKQVDITAQAPGPITPHVQAGAARLLGNWGPKRTAEYPNVPTFIELGYQGRRVLHLGRAVRAEGHARADHHPAARRYARGDEEPAGDRRVRQGREPAGLHGSAGVRRSSSRPTPSGSSPSSGKSASWTRNEDWTFRPHRARRAAASPACSTSGWNSSRLADEAGFYCLHLAEHHQTPLNMVPVPGVFLGAVARPPSRSRWGRWFICCRSCRRCA